MSFEEKGSDDYFYELVKLVAFCYWLLICRFIPDITESNGLSNQILI
jgi:hypothetical protein